MKNLEHKRKNGLMFSTVVIRKITRNRYVAEFDYGFEGKDVPPFETTINGNSAQNCIEKTESFLQTTLTPKEIEQ